MVRGVGGGESALGGGLVRWSASSLLPRDRRAVLASEFWNEFARGGVEASPRGTVAAPLLADLRAGVGEAVCSLVAFYADMGRDPVNPCFPLCPRSAINSPYGGDQGGVGLRHRAVLYQESAEFAVCEDVKAIAWFGYVDEGGERHPEAVEFTDVVGAGPEGSDKFH